MKRFDLSSPTLARYAACTLAGVLYFLCFLNFELFPLAWICFVPALYAISGTTPSQALRCGWVFGFVTNAGGFYWVEHVIQVYGKMHISIALLGVVALAAYQGFMLALALWFVRRAQLSLRIAPVWSLPLAMAALELCYPLLFPSYLANSQYSFTWITQFVDVLGVLGLTALVTFMNGAIFEAIEAFRAKRPPVLARLAVPIAAFVICLGYGLIRLPQIESLTAQAKTLKVALIQTNIGGVEKQEDMALFTEAHARLSDETLATHPDIDLLIWPESAYGNLINKARTRIVDPEITHFRKPLLFGVLMYGDTDGDRVTEIYNSVMLMSATGDVLGTFDKIKLLPFGETMPFSDVFPILNAAVGGGFNRGKLLQHLRLGDTAILPMVCYEDLMPSMVRKLWKGGGPADVLVNVTNDSWYGDTHEPMIHLVLASFRSIETRRALMRSTNTGRSAIVDPTGRIVRRSGQMTREAVVADVPIIEDDSTTVYMKVGDVIGWLAGLGCLVILVRGLKTSNSHSALRRG